MDTTRVVPVVIFMRDSPNIVQHITLGSEHEAYLQFRYIACILPRLPAMAHLNTDNVVTALMLPLMQYAREHRVTVYGEAHRSLRRLEPDPSNRRKYIDFIDIYAALDDEEQQRYKEHYVEEGKEMMGMRERFQQEGRQQGLVSGRQQTLAELLVERFGPLDARVTARIASASLDELKRWTRQILPARTLEEVFRGQ